MRLIFAAAVFQYSLMAGLILFATGQATTPRMPLTVTPTKSEFKVGEQVALKYELKNVAHRHALVVSSPHISGEMQLDIVGPGGTKVRWQGAVASTAPSFRFTLLGPGGSSAGTVVVPLNCKPDSLLGGYCLDKPGK